MSYLKYGPSGGIGGGVFDPIITIDQKPGWKIRKIKLRSGERVSQIQLEWENSKGEFENSPTIGLGRDDHSEGEFDIVSNSYLIKVQGSLVKTGGGGIFISSLQFTTNRGDTSQLFGKDTSYIFSYQAPPEYQIVGIFGRSGSELDSIGFYINNLV